MLRRAAAALPPRRRRGSLPTHRCPADVRGRREEEKERERPATPKVPRTGNGVDGDTIQRGKIKHAPGRRVKHTPRLQIPKRGFEEGILPPGPPPHPKKSQNRDGKEEKTQGPQNGAFFFGRRGRSRKKRRRTVPSGNGRSLAQNPRASDPRRCSSTWWSRPCAIARMAPGG